MTVPAAPIKLPAVEVAPPPVQPYGYGLLSAATVAQDVDRRWEASGVAYPNDGCAPGGGIWVNPCEQPPPTEAVDAFTVTVSQAAAGTVLTITLTARDAAHYPDMPVNVAVQAENVMLTEVGAGGAQTIDVEAPGEYSLYASIGSNGFGPACETAGTITVPEAGTAAPVVLACTTALGWPTKRIPMGQDFTEGRAFMVYEAVGCLPVGFTDASAKANRRLALHEQWWVERQFEATALHGSETVVLNGGAALPLAEAIGLAEDAIADRYGGHGVLHLPREHYTAIPERLLRADGPRKRTPLDNLWALGAGYSNTGPDAAPAPDGQAWIYVTGPVVARRSDVQTRESITPSRNERVAIAERSYVLTADCLRLAVLATITGAA